MVFTNKGRELILTHLNTDVTHMAWGDGSTTHTKTSTALGNEFLRKTILTKTQDNPTLTIDFEGFIASTEANGKTLKEVGIVDAASGGNFFTLHNHPDETKNDTIEFLYNVIIEVA